ncbi:hypothetical protein CEE37_03635 [candidate division LCP-89 bacterium B3_LCP]|uniref:Gingipain R n=1 Tax=candidate division LCP-89 bacterium B3_LCP TaxID=2012998 RepID=A0A532V374_UNCL8|nr:MAG: hypothetical protein CEE37_03635 [candidate division LCP-89 bacterium B3_LCP]
MKLTNTSIYALSLAMILFCFTTVQAEWIAMDAAAPAAPEVKLVSHTSSATVLDVTLAGFYSDEIAEGNEIYQMLSFGDNAALREVGKPQLPVITELIGIPDRSDLRVSMEVLDAVTLTGYNIWPAQEMELDGEDTPPFFIDAQFYTQNGSYPDRNALVSEPQIWRDVRLTRLETRPVSYNPVTDELTVATKMRVKIEYFGQNATRQFTRNRTPINVNFQKLYRAAVINFDHLGYPLDNGGTDNPGTKYLVVTTTPAIPYIQDLVDFRHAQGYETEVRVIEPGFSTAEEIKAYVTELYNLYGLEHILIVGDAYYSGGQVDVPMYYWVDSYSDSWYTMMDGPGDYLADLSCGRIVYDGPTDLTHQIDKTMAYLTAPEVSNWAEHTLLVAHSEQYPLKYTQCKEEIRTYPYSIQVPIFGTAYGGAGASNQDVIDYLNTYSSGILNYRGHGSQTGWASWGTSGSFTATHVYQLTNYDRYFVHYDVCCDNMDFPGYNGDCLAEAFMKAPAAAIAINGAIIPSYTIPNHDYDKEFYKAIYDLGINQIGYASNFANITVYNLHGAIGESNIRTYLWLGDACVDAWTNTMQTLTVTHPSVMLIGTSTLDVNVGFEGALVCAQNSEVYAAGYTDNTGSITLEFNPAPAQPGDLTITVSAHNYLTYQQVIQIIPPSGPFVVYESVEVADDLLGNNNGQLDFGETSNLTITAENVGVALATGVTLNVLTAEPLITILDGTEYVGDIAAGGMATADHGFSIEADPSIADGQGLLFTLEAVSDTTWTSNFSIVAHAPDCEYTSHIIDDPPPGNQNGNFDPGESGTIYIEITNEGSSAVPDLHILLSTADPFVTVPNEPLNIGTLEPGASAQYLDYSVTISASCPQEHVATLNLAFTGGGYSGSDSFEITIGDLMYAPTGPDGYGYYAYDINDGGNAPVFEWIEVAPAGGGPGVEVTALTGQDDRSTLVALPFSFQYYGTDYTDLTICTNGWLALGDATPDSDWSNSAIPDLDGPVSMVAPFWEDMNMETGGQVATYYDVVEGYFVVEFFRVPQWTPATALETFEVIFYDPTVHVTPTGDGKILMQYQQVSDPSSCTVGIENATETDGLQYLLEGTYDIHATPIGAEMAILYMAASMGSDVTVTLTPVGLPIQIPATGGSFDYNIALTNNVATQISCDLWCDVTLPNGSSYGPTLGPVALTIPGGFAGNRDRVQNVPGVAPTGMYTYNGYAGVYPSVIWDMDSFLFEKLATGDGAQVGSWTNYGEPFEQWMTAISSEVVVPDEYSLTQNYPNPFNPVTSISFGLPEAGYVKLAVYDLLGRQVALLVDGHREAGLQEVSFDAHELSSGMYLYRIEAGDFTAVRKMVLMK